MYTSEYRYLGVIFHEHLDFAKHTNTLAASATRALGSVISKYKNNKEMTYEIYSKLVHTCVLPVLDYGSEVYGINKCAEIEKVQNTAARVFLGINRFAPILAIQGDIGWRICQTRIDISILRLWNKFTQMNEDRLCRHVFEWDSDNHQDNWSGYVKKLFDKMNMDNFDSKLPCDIDSCGEKLDCIDSNEWYEKLSFKPKLRSYKKFKFAKFTENYVKMNLSSKERSMLSQFRMGILPINIETGRYRNVPLDKRVCYNCIDTIEDEIHFLLYCPIYTRTIDQFYLIISLMCSFKI